jgi:flagellar basal-body rod protein FlgF
MLSHNLANVSTNGFRAELQAFRAVPVRGDGASTRAYALETTSATTTPRPAPPPAATWTWRCRAMPGWPCRADGTEAYTRAGALDVNAEGSWSRATACRWWRRRPDHRAAQQPAADRLDGTVSAKHPTSAPRPSAGSSWSRPRTRSPAATTACSAAPTATWPPTRPPRLQDGALEGSNVSPVETMVAMIAAARQFEQQMKLLQTAQTQGQQSAKLLGST